MIKGQREPSLFVLENTVDIEGDALFFCALLEHLRRTTEALFVTPARFFFYLKW